jgi:osmotically inducible protein OsmC
LDERGLRQVDRRADGHEVAKAAAERHAIPQQQQEQICIGARYVRHLHRDRYVIRPRRPFGQQRRDPGPATGVPVELGGDGKGTNPEQLFAAGYSACFASALKLVAAQQKVDVSEASVTAEVGLNKAGEGFALSVVLRIELPDELHGEAGQRLIEATHQVCPYSNATRGNIPVELVIE